MAVTRGGKAIENIRKSSEKERKRISPAMMIQVGDLVRRMFGDQDIWEKPLHLMRSHCGGVEGVTCFFACIYENSQYRNLTGNLFSTTSINYPYPVRYISDFSIYPPPPPPSFGPLIAILATLWENQPLQA